MKIHQMCAMIDKIINKTLNILNKSLVIFLIILIVSKRNKYFNLYPTYRFGPIGSKTS